MTKEEVTLEEIQESDWYKSRPEEIRKAIDKMPPTKLYRFKNSKKQCYITGYTEAESDDKGVTLIVQKTGEGGPMDEMGIGALDTNAVFDVPMDNLETFKEE